MVLALFRHGVRSPIVTFPTDPHANYPWVGGMESLQPKGLVQLYELGQSMRARYKFLIPDHVAKQKQKIYAVSSASQRCIDSAQSFLAGFLQTSTTGINGSVVPKQPVLLHIIPGDQDAILYQLNVTCPRASLIRTQLKEDPTSALGPFLREGAILQEYVSSLIGAPVTSLHNLALICDALEMYHTLGLPQPAWAAKVFPERTRELMVRYLQSYSATPELKRIRGGPLLAEFLDKMRRVRDSRMRFGRRIFLYSGHDLTQMSLFNSMDMREQTLARADCGSAVVFELHKSKLLVGDLEVRMIQYATAGSVPKQLEIPRCPGVCSLSEFERSVSHLVLSDLNEACLT
ncbi:hypothetical protein pipiens_005524 [Culex pipiens pipiens]|uniref:Testicular acid phosphatase n=1 Tax=Culex pipiens pipiens TaxID=38569 RepID=A0ABD1DWP3_CULPP